MEIAVWAARNAAKEVITAGVACIPTSGGGCVIRITLAALGEPRDRILPFTRIAEILLRLSPVAQALRVRAFAVAVFFGPWARAIRPDFAHERVQEH